MNSVSDNGKPAEAGWQHALLGWMMTTAGVGAGLPAPNTPDALRRARRVIGSVAQ